jgi:hypothetical protein
MNKNDLFNLPVPLLGKEGIKLLNSPLYKGRCRGVPIENC